MIGMNAEEFRSYAHQLVDWMADYQTNVVNYPVKATVAPKEIIAQLPLSAPQEPESFQKIFSDFKEVILPGITHWQHPAFFAYFPSNTSPPSILAEMLIATLGVQCMSWQTSPAAAELEERVMEWLASMLGLPTGFTGVIQDSASNATLCSLLTARERASQYRCNHHGLANEKTYAVYCSTEAHSSIEKAVKIVGIGQCYLRKIPVDENFALQPNLLEAAIVADIQAGLQPLWAAAALGTTGSTAMDPLKQMGQICQRYNVWLHVDAAYAGSAFILPEARSWLEGIENVDSFVFNPHKWLLTNNDCSVYFVRDKTALIQTFSILPEYLKTKEDCAVNNYRDWSISLGRRFRALKLWFVIRSYGVSNLQKIIRNHIALAQSLVKKIKATPYFEILAPVHLNVICFRYHPPVQVELLNALNAQLLEELNATGKIYLTHTKLAECYVLRLVIAQTFVESEHIDMAWELIQNTANALKHTSTVLMGYS